MQKLKFFFIIICVIQFFYIFNFRTNFTLEIFKNPFSKDSGAAYSVSPEILESKKILKSHGALDFKLSEAISGDSYLFQRSIEFNYPVRIDSNSKFVFYLKREQIPSNCELIETGDYLKFVKC